ncbi:hypothetical protein [Brucella melitensis]|uniref:hypothetical protein n=1 Tax=Brucella melitensis TaxID=29459 RepID=UPI0032BF3A56
MAAKRNGSTFASRVADWADGVVEHHEEVVQMAAMTVFAMIIQRSPVGNPDLWQRNQQAVKERNRMSDLRSAMRDSDTFGYATKRGTRRLKPGANIVAAPARMSSPVGPAGPRRPRLLKNEQGVNPVGKGYVGGRFRGNWQVGLDFIPEEWLDVRDKSGSQTTQNMQRAVETFKVGTVNHIFFVNNSPYGYPLEYEGHSRQAPAGMVRISCIQFEEAFRDALRSTKK